MTNADTPPAPTGGLPDSKAAVQSVTIWGAIIAILSALIPLVAPMLGWTADTQSALLTVLGQVGVLIGGVVAIYGRLSATTSISTLFTSTKPPSGVASVILALVCVGLLVLGAGSLSACATAPGAAAPSASMSATNVTALKSMLYAEAVFNAAANAEIDAKQSGLLTGDAAVKGDALRKQAYGVLLGLRTVYAAGTDPDLTTLLALVNQVLALAGKAPVAATAS